LWTYFKNVNIYLKALLIGWLYTNYKYLEYFKSTRDLNCHQSCWNMWLSCWLHHLTPWNTTRIIRFLILDIISTTKKRRSNIQPTTNDSWRCLMTLCNDLTMLDDSSFLDQVRTTSTLDPLVLDKKHHSHNNHDKFKFFDDFLYFEESLYIPKGSLCLWVFQTHHDFLAARQHLLISWIFKRYHLGSRTAFCFKILAILLWDLQGGYQTIFCI